jgi:hypothetical protein
MIDMITFGRLGERIGKQIPQTNCMRVPVIYNNTDARYERLMCGVSTARAPRNKGKPSKTILHVFGTEKELL